MIYYDSDFDGITDDIDECPSTPYGQAVDEKGCSRSETSAEGITFVPDDAFEQALIDLGYDDVLDDVVIPQSMTTGAVTGVQLLGRMITRRVERTISCGSSEVRADC